MHMSLLQVGLTPSSASGASPYTDVGACVELLATVAAYQDHMLSLSTTVWP